MTLGLEQGKLTSPCGLRLERLACRHISMIQSFRQAGERDAPGHCERDARNPVTPPPTDVLGGEAAHDGGSMSSVGDATRFSQSACKDRTFEILTKQCIYPCTYTRSVTWQATEHSLSGSIYLPRSCVKYRSDTTDAPMPIPGEVPIPTKTRATSRGPHSVAMAQPAPAMIPMILIRR